MIIRAIFNWLYNNKLIIIKNIENKENEYDEEVRCPPTQK